MNEIKVRNFISIDGQPEVLFDALPVEKQREAAGKLQENAMCAVGFRKLKRERTGEMAGSGVAGNDVAGNDVAGNGKEP